MPPDPMRGMREHWILERRAGPSAAHMPGRMGGQGGAMDAALTVLFVFCFYPLRFCWEGGHRVDCDVQLGQ